MPRKRMRQPGAIPAVAQPPMPQGATSPAMPTTPDSSDPIIKQVQDSVRAHIPPGLRIAVMKIEMAGRKVMYDPATHNLMLQTIQQNSDPAEAAGMGVTQLVTILYKESQGRMPIPAIPLAAVLLVCDGLDFMEKAGIVKVTPDIIDRAVQTVIAYLMQKVGLTPNKIATLFKGQQGAAPAAQPGLVAGAMPPQAAAPAAQPPQAAAPAAQPPQGAQ